MSYACDLSTAAHSRTLAAPMEAQVCGAIFAASIIDDQEHRHRRCRCLEFVRNVSSMRAMDVFSRQMQTILV
jgi:hypothetical protein